MKVNALSCERDSQQMTRSMAERLELIRLHGSHSLAYSTLQKGMRYFDTHQGYIAYGVHRSWFGKTIAVLGDPVAKLKNHADLIQQFAMQFPRAIFWQQSKPSAAVLNEMGFYVNQAGLEFEIDLAAFQGNWRTHNSLRRAANKSTRNGVKVCEQSIQDLSAFELSCVSQSWLAGRKNPAANQRFMTRPLTLETEPGVRCFAGFVDKKLVGFRLFDPLFNDGVVVGYYADAVRVGSDAPPGTSYKIMLDAITSFKAQGKQILKLGYSPFAELRQNCEFKSSTPTHLLCTFAFRHLEKIYGSKGILNHKRRFHGLESDVYLASKSVLPLGDMINTCYLTGINVPQQIFRQAKPQLLGNPEEVSLSS